MATKKKQYRAVVVGCGRMGATFEMEPNRPKPASHAGAFLHNKRTELVAVVDENEGLAKKASAFYGVPWYKNAKECFEKEKPDIVAVAVPPGEHEGVIKLALQSGVQGIVCEKPLADTAESAKRIIALLKKTPAVFVVNHQRRFFPVFQKARNLIAEGAIGRIQQVSCFYSNGLLNNGTHTIDAVQFLLDDSFERVLSVENKKNIPCPPGDKNIDGLLVTKKGVTVVLQSFDNEAYGVHDFAVYGTKGALYVHQYGYELLRSSIGPSPVFKGIKELSHNAAVVQKDVRSMVAATTQHVVDCLDGKVESRSTVLDGLKTMETLQALMRSSTKRIGEILV